MLVSSQIWLSSLWTLEGPDNDDDDNVPSSYTKRLVSTLPAVVTANWTLWVPAQVVNFRIIAPKFQVLFSNLTALVWNVYLSFSQTRKQQQVSSSLAKDDDDTSEGQATKQRGGK